MHTRVIALSREAVTKFRSEQPYVVISLTDSDAEHPLLEQSQALQERLTLQFDDVLPENCFSCDSSRPYIAMSEDDADAIARFVERWWGNVATIVVHCHAGLSRSTAVAAAIRGHHQQDDQDLYEAPRDPNRHCLALVTAALRTIRS